ncbi:MAG: hypothetical protein PHU27_04180 [Salinivirgaceae bacterium]|nr:hypothetical protein [Salinivirgaceae bacterium]MDD4747269.1 hypothetical protein [Salinivirgaceae bacterium]
MMKFKMLFVGMLCLYLSSLTAQEPVKSEPLFKYDFYGYVAYDAYVDTHESVITRDGQFYLYPKKPVFHSITNENLNENYQFNMLSLQSRAGVKIQGPDAFNAKTSAVIEADFFGTAEAYKHLLRVRHAYMKFSWENTTLLLGQYWHPLFTPECFPLVISFGASTPYNPLNRSPQIRLDHKIFDDFRIVLVAAEHGYHASVGPEFSQRNAGIPDLQAQIQFKTGSVLFGLGGGYHQLQPLLGTGETPNREKVNAFNTIVFANAKFGSLTIKAKSVVGQDLTDMVMIGGFGRIQDDILNDSTYKYAALISYSNWIDMDYKAFERIGFGLFAGMSGNLGALDKMSKPTNESSLDVNKRTFFDRNSDIAYMFRISPRVSYTIKNMEFAFEYLHDRAYFANSFDEYHKPKTDDLTTGINHRLLFSAKYTFK